MPESVPPFRSNAVVGTTLREHVLSGMHAAPGATGEFTSLLNHISLGIRIINSRVRAAGLSELLGYTGETNVQGDVFWLAAASEPGPNRIRLLRQKRSRREYGRNQPQAQDQWTSNALGADIKLA